MDGWKWSNDPVRKTCVYGATYPHWNGCLLWFSGKLSLQTKRIIQIWLVVSTHLKNICQLGNLPQVAVKIKNIWNHHPEMQVKSFSCWTRIFFLTKPVRKTWRVGRLWIRSRMPICNIEAKRVSKTTKYATLLQGNQLMVNCWFGLVVWIPGIPLWKGLLLGCTPRIPNHQSKPTINH